MDDEAVKARPILFSAPMVRALLEGRKTQTRRRCADHVNIYDTVSLNSAKITFDFHNINSTGQIETCPHGQPGDLLWVRETWFHPRKNSPSKYNLSYRAGGDGLHKWFPSIHMPRWANRLTLEITDVRVERLQGISENDALAEGIIQDNGTEYQRFHVPGIDHPNKNFPELSRISAIEMYGALWDVINGSGQWLANPFVWALTFKVHNQNVDSFLQEREAA
jgi:hypothetical protein